MPSPKKNTAFVFDVPLVDASNRPSFKAAPTIAAGDFKVSTDESAFANLATLPTVTPAGGVNVKVSLSASEMNGDRIVVQCIDQTSPKEWDDVLVTINTTTNTIDDAATSLDAVLEDTAEMQAAHTAGTLGVNVKKINSVTLTGNGTTIPMDAL